MLGPGFARLLLGYRSDILLADDPASCWLALGAALLCHESFLPRPIRDQQIQLTHRDQLTHEDVGSAAGELRRGRLR